MTCKVPENELADPGDRARPSAQAAMSLVPQATRGHAAEAIM
jgi:hypothetical protein